ncbi:MAG TPA: amidohydrolase family protein [Candidatus Limnocylindrales bacterium]|nr:amidohydrolase family protein [Candidatus Limnocylindrales bacterium]
MTDAQARPPRIVFGDGRLFDGSARLQEAEIAVEGERIVEVGQRLDGDERVDLGGRAVLPGLFDCHTHVVFSHVDLFRIAQTPFSLQFFLAARNLAATLRIGITSARDAGYADLGIKEAVAQGLIPGPRLQISLVMLSQTGGHGDDWLPGGAFFDFLPPHPGRPSGIVDGPDEVRRKVRELVRMGADVIKVAVSGGVLSPRDKPTHAHFRPAELEAIVEEATAAGIPCMAHAQAAPGIKNAVRAGFRSIDHGVYLDDEAIELMLDHGTWLVPTLVAPEGVIRAAEAGAAIPESSLAKAHEVVEIHKQSFRRAVEAGVRIAMGTDSGVTPHGQNLRELALMAANGMAPAEVLQATTSSAAELMGLERELGTLEPGKRADLVVVEGDPFDFEALDERIAAVWQDGKLVAGGPGAS